MNLKRFFGRRASKPSHAGLDGGGTLQLSRSHRPKIIPQTAPPDLSGLDGIWKPMAPPAIEQGKALDAVFPRIASPPLPRATHDTSALVATPAQRPDPSRTTPAS